jgi:endonuclease YncB( thermonuclease family)
MARLAWQNVEAPNLAPAMQGFANVTTLLQKALESASTNPMLENQIKQEELNAKIRKAKNDANTLAANRAINTKVAMSPSAQALQQGLQNGSILGEDYLDASPEVISGARTAVGDMLTNSLNQDKVSALVPDRNLAWLELQYAGDPIGYQKALQSNQFLLPSTVNASPEAIRNLGTGLTTARTNYDNTYQQNQLEVTDANKKFATDLYGQISAMGLPKADQLNFMQSEAYRLGATPGQLGAMALLAKEQGLSNDPIAAPATTGKTGTTPAGTALGAASAPPIDYAGSSVNLGVMRNVFGNKPLPQNINTLGEFVSAKKSGYFTNKDGEINTPTGPLQITADTFADHGNRVFGKDWDKQSINDPLVHYKVGESIFKEVGGDTDKLISKWASLKKLPRSQVEQIAKAPWDKAAPIIAAAENSGVNAEAAANSMRLGLNDYGKTQVDNFKGRASRAIAQISADPIVLNYSALSKSILTADQVALDGVKTSVDFGTLNKDDQTKSAQRIKRTIEYVQKKAGNNISAELAFAVAKQAYGDEWFRVPLVNDLDLDTPEMNKIITGIKSKGGYADQAGNLEKLNLGLSKLNAAEDKFNLAQQKLSEFSQRTTGNGYSEPARQKLEADRNLARERLSEITKTMQASGLYEPKENVTVEQKLDNAASPVDNTPKATYEERQQKANAEFGSTQSTKEFNLKRLKLLDLSGKTDTDFSKSGEAKLDERVKYYTSQGLNQKDASKAASNEYERWYDKNVLKVENKELAKQRVAQAKLFNDFVRTGKRTPASDAVAQSLQVTNPADVKPVAAPIPVPIKVDGKSGTGTTFKVDTQTGKTVPVTPLKLDPNVKYEKPVTVVKADRSGGAKAILYYVGDGDGSNITLSQVDANNLNNGKTDLACRMDTIDADETTGPGKSWTIDQPNGIQARDYLRNLIASGSVTVIVTKPAAPKGEPKTSKNNYGRPLCKIEIEGVGIDMSMIKAGMATWYSQYSNDPALKAAEEKAKQDKVGRWKNPDVMNPADFRHGGWQQFLK